jgi:hypothetical protein
MTFTLAGSVITQADTDTDLSGLTALAGVTVSTQAGYTIYNIGDRQLNVGGTLTIDPEIEMLLLGYDGSEDLMTTTGDLTIGKAIVYNGVTRYSEGLAIYCDTTPTGFVNRISFNGSANLTWNGGTISLHNGKFGFYGNDVKVRINSDKAVLFYRVRDASNQVRQETSDFISTAFQMINGSFTVIKQGLVLGGYTPTHCTGSLGFSGATPNVEFILRDYGGGGRGNYPDVKFWGGNRTTLYNSKSGTELTAHYHINNTLSVGILRVYQELDIKTTKFVGGVVAGAKVWFQDYNNGNRKLYNYELPAINLTGTFTYTGTSDASGDIPKLVVMTGAVISDTSYGRTSDGPNSGRYSWDYRSKSNNIDDLFDMKLIAYDQDILSLVDVELKGGGGSTLNAVFFEDKLTSEPLKATVDAYPFSIALTADTITVTGNGNTLRRITSEQIYDKVKSFLVDSYAGEAQTIVTRSGSTLNARALNLTLDYITLTGGVLTTGALSLTNGSTVSGGVSDSSSNSVLVFSGIASWKLYSTDSDRNTDSNLVDSGMTNYRFVFVANTTFFLRLTINRDIIFQDITPIAIGETIVELSTAALLASISAETALSQIAAEEARDAALALPAANTIVDALLNVPHGKRTDGSVVTADSLGEHWWIFYPPEIVRQILEAGLNGTTPATRYRPSAGTLSTDSLGKVLEATGIDAKNSKDHAQAANVQTKTAETS